MPVLYSKKEINDILRELKIRPIDGKVNGNEAASILTWRAQHEYKDNAREYTAQSVRRHVSLGNLTAHPVPPKHGDESRKNLYYLDEVLSLPLAPKRGAKPKEPVSSSA